METLVLHLRFAGGDVRGHVISSFQMYIQYCDWKKEETYYSSSKIIKVIKERKYNNKSWKHANVILVNIAGLDVMRIMTCALHTIIWLLFLLIFLGKNCPGNAATDMFPHTLCSTKTHRPSFLFCVSPKHSLATVLSHSRLVSLQLTDGQTLSALTGISDKDQHTHTHHPQRPC